MPIEEIELEDAETWAELQQVLINIVESNLKEI